MDEVKWLAYQRRAKEAADIRAIVLELYPGHTLRMAFKMPYRQARRKYKEGLRAIPIKFTTGTRWMLMDFGEIGIRSSEAKRLGSELTDIFISALFEGYNVYVRYENRPQYLYRGIPKARRKVPRMLELCCVILRCGHKPGVRFRRARHTCRQLGL